MRQERTQVTATGRAKNVECQPNVARPKHARGRAKLGSSTSFSRRKPALVAFTEGRPDHEDHGTMCLVSAHSNLVSGSGDRKVGVRTRGFRSMRGLSHFQFHIVCEFPVFMLQSSFLGQPTCPRPQGRYRTRPAHGPTATTQTLAGVAGITIIRWYP